MRSCPRCNSWHVEKRRWACRIAGAIGTVVGTVGGALPILSGAEAGCMLGAIAGPPGAVAGSVCGAVLSGLTGGTSGCLIGTRLGQAIDKHLLDNLRCGACRHTFSRTEAAHGQRQGFDPCGFDRDDEPSYDG